jgi:hypothetical protein
MREEATFFAGNEELRESENAKFSEGYRGSGNTTEGQLE